MEEFVEMMKEVGLIPMDKSKKLQMLAELKQMNMPMKKNNKKKR